MSSEIKKIKRLLIFICLLVVFALIVYINLTEYLKYENISFFHSVFTFKIAICICLVSISLFLLIFKFKYYILTNSVLIIIGLIDISLFENHFPGVSGVSYIIKGKVYIESDYKNDTILIDPEELNVLNTLSNLNYMKYEDKIRNYRELSNMMKVVNDDSWKQDFHYCILENNKYIVYGLCQINPYCDGKIEDDIKKYNLKIYCKSKILCDTTFTLKQIKTTYENGRLIIEYPDIIIK